MKNNNGAIIRHLTHRSLKANKKRNYFIITAIALTTLLIASVFSIGMSLLESVKMEQIRFAGTVAHAAVGHPTASQIEQLHALDYVKTVGTGNNVGFVKNTPQMGKIALSLHYFDRAEWEELRAPACTDIAGRYPQQENEIMVSRGALSRLGINNPTLGMEIPLNYHIESGNEDTLINGRFRLSGWFSSYALLNSMNSADTILVSEKLSQKYGKTVEKDGSATVMFHNDSKVLEYCEKLKQTLRLSENQPVLPSQPYDLGAASVSSSLLALSAITAFLILTGYLLIYNVLYISVSRDVRFYGLLKTLGTTPRQIRQIVFGQILRLCLLGIPIGIMLALLFSLKFVPFFISELGAVSTAAVVSFSPVIYLGAVVFPLFTAILGAWKPAKKAAGISPIEAQKYTGVAVKTKTTPSSAHGKPYKMAIRNIFRDKKRAVVVLLSLFLGVTTFLTVTALVFSMDMDNYVESMYKSDFILKNNTVNTIEPKKKFENDFLNKLKALPGFERLNTKTREWMRLDYSSKEFGQYVTDYSKQNKLETLTEADINRNFRGFIVGVDGEVIKKMNESIHRPINVEAFERGEFALIATDNPGLFSNIHQLAISPLRFSKSGLDELPDSKKVNISLGGFIPYSFSEGGSLAPTVYVSGKLLPQMYHDPNIWEINLDVSSDYEQNALMALKQMIGSDFEISLTSKLEAMEELNSAKMVLLVLGGGIALVIALIGILNFINVMSVGIMVRRQELATLECVGMSRKQVRKMLVSEGLGYAVITLFFVLTLGSAAAFGIFKLFQQEATYATFSYPFIPVLIAGLAVLAVCILTPEKVYRTIHKATIVERLREAE